MPLCQKTAVLALLSSLFYLTSCQCPKEHQYDEKSTLMNDSSEQTITINIQGEPTSLNPHIGFDLNCRSVQKSLFECLTRISPGNKPEPALAEKIEISPSKTIYTFTLRPSQWSNGEPLTAHHFASAWKRGIAHNSNCVRGDLFYQIKNARSIKKGELPLEEVGIKVLDDKTLRVELEHPTPYFLELIALPHFAPQYDDSVEPTVFNGPFLVKSWDREKLLTLEQNPYYWDAKAVHLKKIAFSLVHDPNTALLMYEKGELDWNGSPFTLLSPDVVPRLENENKISSKPVTGVYWFSCNTGAFPLNSVHIRKALSYSINRSELAEIACVETPTRTLIPLHMLPLKEEELYPEHDVKLALAEFEEGLKELNLTRENFPAITLSHSDVAGQKHLAEAVAENWEKTLGIKVELTGYEWNTFFHNLGSKQYHVGGCIWYFVVNDPIYALEFFKDISNRYNVPGWSHPDYIKLLDLAEAETDLHIRKEHLRQAEKILLSEMPIIPVYVSNYKYLVRDTLKDVTILSNGIVDFKWAYVTQKGKKA